MTPPDDGRDEPPQGKPDGPDLPFDEDAAWRLIVENYGDRPEMGSDSPPRDSADSDAPAAPVTPVVDRSYLEALEAGRADAARAAEQAAAHDEEEHFVPPDPPPVPKGTPARRLAWAGLFVPPLLMLAAVVFGWTFATWFSMMLVASFVGGFVFLIATMPRDGGDRWDDGAVV